MIWLYLYYSLKYINDYTIPRICTLEELWTSMPSLHITTRSTNGLCPIIAVSNYIASIIKNDTTRNEEINDLIEGFKGCKSFNFETVNIVLNRFDAEYEKCLYAPNTSVGVLASTSISEAATQNVLNAFHYSGTTSGSQCPMAVGLPRILELLSLTKEQKITSLKFTLNNQPASVAEIYKHAHKFQYKCLKNFVESYAVEPYIEPQWFKSFCNKVCNIDGSFFSIPRKGLVDNPDAVSKTFMLKLKVNTYELYKHQVSMLDICIYINETYLDLFAVCSPNNLSTIIILSSVSDEKYFKFIYGKIKDLEMCGIYNIKKVFVKPTKEIETIGGLLKPTMLHPEILGTSVVSNNVLDTYNTLGIEASRQVLVNELKNAFSHSGIAANENHIGLLADVMANSGVLKPVNRYGLDNDSVISSASFEMSLNVLLNAALNHRTDTIQSASANILCGNLIRGGTGNMDLFLGGSELPIE